MARAHALVLIALTSCGNSGDRIVWRGTLKHTTTSVIAGGMTTEVRSAGVALTRDPSSSAAGGTNFRPAGQWTFERFGMVAGCTLTIEPIDGVLDGAADQGALFVDFNKIPSPYGAGIATGPFEAVQTLVCPDPAANVTAKLPFDEALLSLDPEQGFTLAADATRIEGSTSVPGGTYVWSLEKCDLAQVGAPDLCPSARKWTCTASCNLEGTEPQCTGRVTGTATATSEYQACLDAKRVATQSAPRGCYARHCQCSCAQT